MDQFNLPTQKPLDRPTPNVDRVQQFLRENGEFLALVALFIGVWVYDETVGFALTATTLIGWGKNLLSWAVGAVVVLCIFKLLWPVVRPFVCVALGLITCWVIWRLGLW